VAAFLACHTQWQYAGMGGRTGLRYEGCIALLDSYLPRWQVDDPPTWGALTVADLMEQVQVIEGAMLTADNEIASARKAAA